MKKNLPITEYLLKNYNNNNSPVFAVSNKFKRDDKDSKNACFNNMLKRLFTDIDCKYYEQVAFGEGNEKEKIDSVYSSSLQSLLIFSQVKEGNAIVINGIPYTHVQFEYKNKVIGTPSSMDVVLSNENNTNVLFIESKLYEIVRDSSREGTPEIGPSYLSNNENGYSKFDLKVEELAKIGIEIPTLKNEPFKSKAEVIKDELKTEHKKEVNKDGYIPVNKLPNAEFVYSYGIKQFLSHIIGLTNIDHPSENCSKEFKNTSASIKFISLYNELPGYDEEDAIKKISNFVEHEKTVGKLLAEKNAVKGKIEILDPLSYQQLFNDNKHYFSGMEKIVDFYHLKG